MICVEEMTDLSEREDIIWLTPEEFDIKQLTYLFGGSSKRRKDEHSLFPHLKDRIYRCREFPHGIYINKFGELCPKDSRSGVYQEIEPDMQPDSDCDNESDDPDNDESKDSADEAWAKEEEKVKQKKEKKQNKKRKREESEDDEDYEKSEESDADEEDMSDAEEVLSDSKEEDEVIEEEDDEDWEPSKKKAKKNPKNTIVIDDSDDSRSVDTDRDEEEDDEIVEITQEKTKAAPTSVVEDLKSSVEMVEHYTNIENRRKLERLRTDKLIHYLETLTEEWAEISKEKKRTSKDTESKEKPKPIKMTYESELLSKEPSCEFVFRRAGSKVKGGITAELDCEKTNLICMCGQTDFENTRAMYEHIDNHFLGVDH